MIIIGGFRGAWGACARPHMGKFFHFHAIFKQKSVNTVKHAPLLGSRPLIWKILDPPLIMPPCVNYCSDVIKLRRMLLM